MKKNYHTAMHMVLMGIPVIKPGMLLLAYKNW